MGRDCVRYIEVKRERIKATIDFKNLKKLGCLSVGDVIMCYNTDKHYRRISKIDENGRFTYEIIQEPTTVKESLAWDRPNIDFYVESTLEIPYSNVSLKEGDVYKCWKTGNSAYFIYKGVDEESDEIIWEETDTCETYWEPLIRHTRKGDNPVMFDTRASSYFVTKFIDVCWDGEGEYSRRGIPEDISDIIKKDLEDQFNYTYCSISDLDSALNTTLEKVKNRILEAYNNTHLKEINDNLETLLKLCVKPVVERTLPEKKVVKNDADDVYDYDEPVTPSEVFDDVMWDLMSVHNEISSVKAIVESYYGYVSDSDIRVIYAINN